MAARHQQQRFAIRKVIDLLDRHEQIVRSPHVAKLTGLGDHIEHGPTQKAHLATILERQLKNHRHTVNRAGKGGDDHPALSLGHVAIEVGEHGTLWRTEARHLGIG